MDPRQTMQVRALRALGAYAARKEEAEEGAGDGGGFGVATVEGDVAAARCVRLGEVLVFAVAARPFVVPDVEDCACLGRGLGGHGAGVDLGARWAALFADDLLDFAFGGGDFLGGCGEVG